MPLCPGCEFGQAIAEEDAEKGEQFVFFCGHYSIEFE